MHPACTYYITTTVAPDDFVSVEMYLYFNTNDFEKCYNISIVNDDDCELKLNESSGQYISEAFSLSLTSFSSNVTIISNNVKVTIDDLKEPECGM